jgi:hypothetical protein
LEIWTLAKVLRPLVGSFSTSIGLFIFESIVTPNNLDVKTEIAYEILKFQLTMN